MELENNDMSLRYFMKRITVDTKSPITFNVYGYKTKKKETKEVTQGMLLFSFIHNAPIKDKIISNDYECLDAILLLKEVLKYTIVTATSIDVIIDKEAATSQNTTIDIDTDPEIVIENNGSEENNQTNG